MADDWIKMRSNLRTDPDVIQIASTVGLDEFGALGRLHAVWSWLDQHSTDGTNVRITSAFLDRLTACPGFADAMRAVNWLAGRDGALDFPGYETHNGTTAKKRAVETKRKREQREREERERREREGERLDKCPDGNGTFVPDDVPQGAGLEKRREEVRDTLSLARESNASEFPNSSSEDDKDGGAAGTTGEPGRNVQRGEPLPEWFTPELTEAWHEWMAHIAELNVPVTRMTRLAWYRDIQQYGIPHTIKTIAFSLSIGAKRFCWDGKFQANGSTTAPRSKPAQKRERPAQPARPSTLFPDGAPAGVKSGW